MGTPARVHGGAIFSAARVAREFLELYYINHGFTVT